MRLCFCLAMFCSFLLAVSGRMTGGCLGGENVCLVWGHVMGNISMPCGTYSYPGILHIHMYMYTLYVRPLSSHTNPVMRRGGGVKHFSNGTGSVGTVGTTQHATASNMWTGLTGSCCGYDIALGAKGIHSPVHSLLFWHLSGFHICLWHDLRGKRLDFFIERSWQFMPHEGNVSWAYRTTTLPHTSVQHNGKVWKRVTNFTTFPHILKRYLLQRCPFLHTDSQQILSSGYNSRWNPMSVSVRLYYDFIWLNGRNRRTLDLVRELLKSTPGALLFHDCAHRWSARLLHIFNRIRR